VLARVQTFKPKGKIIVDILVLSCVASETIGQKVIDTFCCGAADSLSQITTSTYSITVHHKEMPLVTYHDGRTAKSHQIRFLDFSKLDMMPSLNTLDELNDDSIQIKNVLLIANLDDIYQAGTSCLPFFSIPDKIDSRVALFAEALNNHPETALKKNAQVVITSGTHSADIIPKIVQKNLNNYPRPGFCENRIGSLLTKEQTKDSMEMIKSLWHDEAWEPSYTPRKLKLNY